MKTLRFLVAGAIALSVLWACSDDEDEIVPEPGPGTDPTEEYDEAYYAEHATVSSEDALFTATDEGGEIAFKVEGGEVVVIVDCGVEWTAAVEYLDEEEGWLDAAVNCDAGALTVTAEANTAEAEKTATVTVMTAESSIEFATISVTQNAYGGCEITVESNEWNAPAVGALTTEIAVEANADWEITNTTDWLTAEKTDTGLKLTASKNEETEGRTAEVVLTCTDGISSASETITVTQDGKAYVNLSSEAAYFGSEAGSQSVDVDSNFDCTSSADKDWITVSTNGNTLTVSVSANETYNERTGNVTVTASDGAENKAEATIKVTQSYFSSKAFVLEYTMTSNNLEAMLPLAGTVDCTVDWGDGSEPQTVTDSRPTHTYENFGVYEIQITGTVTGIDSYVDKNTTTTDVTNYLTAVKQWGDTGLTSMEYAFRGCNKMETLPEETGNAFANVTTFSNAFYNCSKLTSLPGDLFANCPNVTTFEYVFYGCTGFTSLPDKFFANCPNVTTFDSVFYGCTGLTSFQADLFANCPDVTSFHQAFVNCTSLEKIPDGFFDKCTKVTDFSYVFYNCEKVQAIPEGLFDASKATVTTVTYAFGMCFYVKEVPDELLKDFTALTDVKYIFYDCTGLTSTGSRVFSGCTSVKANATYLFYKCTALEKIEGDLFEGFTSVTSLADAFYGCTKLTTIPETLFADCTEVTTFNQCFYGCTALKEIPAGLFDKNTKVTNFGGTFRNCSSLTGESPYTDVNGTKVHLYERDDHADVFTKPTTYNLCFTNCTGLTDYYDIPSKWGGGGN